MKVDGLGKRNIMIIGESPGNQEDECGRPFVGRSGQKLEAMLFRLGVDLRKDCWISNAIVCHPEGNAKPADRQIHYCRPNVIGAIERLKPNVVILLGRHAVKSVIGWFWKDQDVGGITRWAGYNIPCQRPNVWICPSFHPAFVLREEEEKRPIAGDLLERHLEAAIKHDRPPWDSVPDYRKQVEVVFDTDEAARRIRHMIEMTTEPKERSRYIRPLVSSGEEPLSSQPIAFDYETTCRKPDNLDTAEIVCCGVCRGEKAFAYPWEGAAIDATFELLRSNVKKVGQNVKFEYRWTERFFGKGVRGFIWDDMLTTHVLDARKGVTGLKFQTFAHFGVEDYDSFVAPYLEAKEPGGMVKNRIREAGLRNVLEYCALDCLFEYMLYQKQKQEMEWLTGTDAWK